jgi:hypothetical protein
VEAPRSAYEVRVGTVVSAATLATLRVPVRPTLVPRNTVYRIRIAADRDLSEVLHRLIEHDVQLMDVRRCAEPSPPVRPAAPAPSQESGDLAPTDADGVVIPFPGSPRPSSSGAGSVRGRRSWVGPGIDDSAG